MYQGTVNIVNKVLCFYANSILYLLATDGNDLWILTHEG
jgi:hypothetical protein